jgi:hypothetical protein
MSLFDYDYDDLARQIQGGLERLAVNFLRGHGARVRRDLVDFHGYEQVDLELTHDGHTLKVYQVGRPRGPGIAVPEVADHLEEAFESTFDGWPAADVPRETIARWLAALPAGEAPPELSRGPKDPTNPFAVDRPRSAPRAEREPASNPFLTEQPRQAGSNPFLNTDREEKRREMLRRLKGDEEE